MNTYTLDNPLLPLLQTVGACGNAQDWTGSKTVREALNSDFDPRWGEWLLRKIGTAQDCQAHQNQSDAALTTVLNKGAVFQTEYRNARRAAEAAHVAACREAETRYYAVTVEDETAQEASFQQMLLERAASLDTFTSAINPACEAWRAHEKVLDAEYQNTRRALLRTLGFELFSKGVTV